MESAFDGLDAVPAALELRAKDSIVESNPPPPSASTDDRARRRPPPMESAFDGLDATPREGTAVPAALELRAKDSTVELVLQAGATGGGAGRQRAGSRISAAKRPTAASARPCVFLCQEVSAPLQMNVFL